MGSIAKFGAFLLALLLWIPQKVWELLLDGLATVIEAIPVPGFATQTSQALGGLTSDILWWTSLFQVPTGFAMVLSAYIARFVLRRIPLIGG